MPLIKFKIIIVGDSGVGKSSFVANLTNSHFPSRRIPTVIDFGAYKTSAYGFNFKLLLKDTSAIQQYKDMRTAFYNNCHVVFLCFSLADPDSFENVKNEWWPELEQFAPDKPVILVGMKEDLRTNRLTHKKLERQRLSFVSTREGRNLARQLGFSAYVEMSSKLKDDGKKVVDEALRVFCVPEPQQKPPNIFRRMLRWLPRHE